MTVGCDGSVANVRCLSHVSILTWLVDERVMEWLKIECAIASIVMIVKSWVIRWILVTLACVVMSILMMSLSLSMMSASLTRSLASVSFTVMIVI